MSPTCEVLLESGEAPILDTIDAFLAPVADEIERTRRGRVWNVWIGGRPIHVAVVCSPLSIEMSAGCNDAEDYAALRKLAEGLAEACDGLASEPIK